MSPSQNSETQFAPPNGPLQSPAAGLLRLPVVRAICWRETAGMPGMQRCAGYVAGGASMPAQARRYYERRKTTILRSMFLWVNRADISACYLPWEHFTLGANLAVPRGHFLPALRRRRGRGRQHALVSSPMVLKGIVLPLALLFQAYIFIK